MKKTFEVAMPDGKWLRVQISKIKNNKYNESYSKMMSSKNISGDRVRCEWTLKKIDFIRWLTEGEFNAHRPCSTQTLMFYGDRKFRRMKRAGFTDREILNIDNVFWSSEGLYTEETFKLV